MISKRDVQLGKIAMRAGMVSKDQITRCLALKKKLAETKGKKVALGALLVKKGYLTSEQLEELVALHNQEGGAAASAESSGEEPAKPARKKAAKKKKGTESGTASEPEEPPTRKEGPRRSARQEAAAAEAPEEGAPRRSARQARAAAEEASSAEPVEEEAPRRAGKKKAGEKKPARKKKGDEPPAKEPTASESSVDPAIFQSAAEDAVDEVDKRLIACPECGKKYRLRRSQAGKRFGCRRCKHRIKVPADLFERPLEPASHPAKAAKAAAEKLKGAGPSGRQVEVEEFLLSSSETAPDDDGGAGAVTQRVQQAAATAQLAVQKVQKQSLGDLARQAAEAQRKPLGPRRKFGPMQALTMGLSGLLLVGVVGGVVYWQRQLSEAAERERLAKVEVQLVRWREGMEAAVAAARKAGEGGDPFEIGAAISRLQEQRGRKSELMLADNLQKARAWEQAQEVDGLERDLQMARARAFRQQGGIEGAVAALAALEEASRVAGAHEETRVALGVARLEARRFLAAAEAVEPLGDAPAARALRGLALERAQSAQEARKAYAGLGRMGEVLGCRAILTAGDPRGGAEAARGLQGLEGAALAAAQLVVARGLAAQPGKEAEAAAAIDAAVAAAPDLPFAYLARGEHLLAQGRPDEALAAFQEGQQRSGTARGFYGMAEAHLARLDLPRARSAYEEAVRCPPGERGHLVEGLVDPFAGAHDPDYRVAASCRLAALLLAEGRVDEAAAAYQQAQLLDPHDPAVEAGLGRVDVLRQNLPQAEQRFRRALGLCARTPPAEAGAAPDLAGLVGSPRTGEVLVAYGEYLIAHGRPKDALEVLQQGASASPDLRPQAAALRGRSYEDQNIMQRAAQEYQDAARLEVGPETPAGRTYGEVARAAETVDPSDRQAVARALAGITAVLALNPHHAHAYLARARVAIRSGDFDAGLAALDRALVANSFLREGYLQRAFYFLRELPPEKRDRAAAARAKADLEVAERLSGGDPPARLYYGLGLAHEIQRDYTRARQACDRAIELDMDFAPAYELRARMLDLLKKPDEAARDRKKFEELSRR